MSRYHRAVAIAVVLGASGAAETTFADEMAPRPRKDERQGLLVGGEVALGASSKSLLGQLDGRLGWMVTPRLGVFGAALTGTGVGWEITKYRMEGAGLRGWLSDAWFLEGSIGRVHTEVRDEDDDRRTERSSGLGYLLEFGVEGVLSHVGLNAHLAALRTGEFAGILFGVGMSYY